MAILTILRFIAFGIALVSALIMLALSADIISTTEKYYKLYRPFSAMGIAVGFLTFITLGPSLVIDLYRSGAFTSMIAVEFSVISALWVLFLTTGALAASDVNTYFPDGCSFVGAQKAVDILTTTCNEFSAVTAFSFIGAFILLAYSIVLLVYVLMGANRSDAHTAWTSSASTLPHRTAAGAAIVSEKSSGNNNIAPQFQNQPQVPYQQNASYPPSSTSPAPTQSYPQSTASPYQAPPQSQPYYQAPPQPGGTSYPQV